MAKPGRHAEGAQTRERILDAAAKFIGTHGYAATSIAKIGREAGANPASIYWAFKNKESLFAAVMERAADDFFETIKDARPGTNDPFAALAGLAKYFADGPEFLRLMLVLSLERRDGDPAVMEAARRVRAFAAESLAEGFAKALDTPDAARKQGIAEELARLALMLIDGAFVASQIEPDTTDLDRVFELIAVSVASTGTRLLEEAASVAS